MALLHHFFVAVAPTMADDGGSPIKWRAQLPNAVFASDCSLHALLAVSALHLARQRPMQREECLRKATEYHALTLAPLIDSLTHLDQHNAETTFLAAVFLCYHNLAKGPQPGQYLGFGDQADGEWIWVIKGAPTVLSMVRPFPHAQAESSDSPMAIPNHSPRETRDIVTAMLIKERLRRCENLHDTLRVNAKNGCLRLLQCIKWESAPTPSLTAPVLDYDGPLTELSRIVALLEGEALCSTKYMQAVATLRTAFEACFSLPQEAREEGWMDGVYSARR